MRRLSGPVAAIIAAVVYTAGMALNWLITSESYATETARLVRSSIPALIILVIAMFALARFARIPVQGDRRMRAWWVWIPVLALVLVPLATVAFLATNPAGTDWALVLGVLVGTLLVGFGEETAYRAVGVTGLAEKFTVPVAVVISSILFGLLHTVNVLADASNVGMQVAQTTVIGVGFGWVYVLSGRNLVLVALLHGLYDWGMIAANVPDARQPNILALLVFVGVAVWLLFSLVMLVVGFIGYRGRKLPEI